jgi:hypothetical protein
MLSSYLAAVQATVTMHQAQLCVSVYRHDLAAGYLGFRPDNHELQSCLVIDRLALARRRGHPKACHSSAEDLAPFRRFDTVGAELGWLIRR